MKLGPGGHTTVTLLGLGKIVCTYANQSVHCYSSYNHYLRLIRPQPGKNKLGVKGKSGTQYTGFIYTYQGN